MASRTSARYRTLCRPISEAVGDLHLPMTLGPAPAQATSIFSYAVPYLLVLNDQPPS